MTEINERLAKLRELMNQEGISACIIPGTDPHASEYIADYWKEREWISGFDGAAGTAVITTEKAGVWTDSRYFLQGAEQLAGTDSIL
jgi:Xaa-Pro aminopeptidase